MRRTGIAIVASVVLLVGGCDRSPHTDNDHGEQRPAPLTALDAFAAAGIRAERVVPTAGPGTDRDRYFDTRDDSVRIVAVGTSLVALAIDRDGDVYFVVRSADLGKTWQYVDLPEVTASITRLVLAEVGPVVVATGGTDNDSAWVTADGTGWRGGPVPTKPDGALLAEATRQPDGRIVVGTQGKEGNRLVLTADAGVTWQTVDCPSMFRPAAHPLRCEVARPAGGNLWIRGGDVSLDAGQTWRPAVVAPAVESSMAPKLAAAVAMPGGGWLGTVVTMPGPTMVAERLAVSADGLAWELRPSPCGGAEGSTVSLPRAIGDRWLVTHTCLDEQDAPLRSVLHLIDTDGRSGKALASLDRPGLWFGAPVSVGDAVVVPEVRGGGPGEGTLALLTLRVS